MKGYTAKTLALILLCVTLTIVFGLTYYVHELISQNANQRFSVMINKNTVNIEDRLHKYEQVLRGGRGLFEASNSVEYHEWRSYVAAQKLQDRYPGIQGVGFSKYIGSKQSLDKHIEEFRQIYGKDYTVRPDYQRDEYTSIIYLEPQDKRNQVAIGYDMFSESIRRDAMIKSRNADETSLSGKVTLVQEIDKNKQSGFLMYLPVYKNGLPHQTVLERRTNLFGWVYEPFRAGDFVNGALIKSEKDLFDVILYDNSVSESSILYSTYSGPKFGDFKHVNAIEFSDRKWILEYYPSEKFLADIDRSTEFFIIIGGSLSSILFSHIAYSSLRSRDEFERLVALSNEIIEKKLDVKIDDRVLSSSGRFGNIARAINNIREKMIKIHLEEEQIMREKDEFASMMSHELKSPLVPILGYCEMLSDPTMFGALNAEQKDAVKEISVNATTLQELITDLLDLNKLELGKLNITRSSFQLSDFFNEILAKFYPLAIEKNIEFKLDCPVDSTIYTDRKRFNQVFSNIILNSVDFLPKQDAIITIGNKTQKNEFLFFIRDNGVGISESKIVNIFQKFYQVDASLARTHGGTGLGLSICKELITLLGGKIWVESTLGKETTFYFTLPRGDQD